MSKSYVEQYLHIYNVLPTAPLPTLFDFPHQYVPNEWAQTAAEQLQELIPNTFNHEFNTLGKMFGVLVVDSPLGIGFLAGFSGKIDESTQFPGFVPPIYDTLNTDAFFKQGERVLNDLTHRINQLSTGESLSEILKQKYEYELDAQEQITVLKNSIKAKKDLRDTIRNSPNLTAELESQLANESKQEQLILKNLKKEIHARLEEINAKISLIQDEITALKEKRTNQSIALQQELFKAYRLVNFNGEASTVLDVFKAFNGDIPPSGTGECALPKLLHFAALNQLKPICFAEFWWGRSPAGEIRKHGHFYPACRAKCEPILGFMLQGISVAKNPILSIINTTPLRILYEDDFLIIIDKPSGLLSVPGRSDLDSAEDRLALREGKGAYIKAIHRLDMGTSGILMFAKSPEILAAMQTQFAKNRVTKTYEALLDGIPKELEGIITLPLRLNLDHRPHQMVCFEHGKKTHTEFNVLEFKDKRTRIEFYPKTGRTHQLRVHAAHPMGLNCAILGDDLYGTASDRLHLHAKEIECWHPVFNQPLKISCETPF
jgi:tRNA pseudouridine32 synthase / 23S rRNA pseudouridine746 synthase